MHIKMYTSIKRLREMVVVAKQQKDTDSVKCRKYSYRMFARIPSIGQQRNVPKLKRNWTEHKTKQMSK